MTTGDLKVCNLEYLFELAKGDKEFVKEMIQVFLAENPEEINNLEKAVSEMDFPVIRQVCHKLRSSIPYMGLDSSIGEEVAEMESLAAKSAGAEIISGHFKKVNTICDKAVEELQLLKI